MQLDPAIYEQIQSLSAQGNTEIDQGHLNEAIALWQQALTLLPAPQNQWQAAFWLNASIGEAYYQLKQFDHAIAVLKEASLYPEAEDNPYPSYMIGKCYWRLEHEHSVEYLITAYDLDGEGIFSADGVEGEMCLQFLYDKGILKV